jgi:hypothetical protein
VTPDVFRVRKSAGIVVLSEAEFLGKNLFPQEIGGTFRFLIISSHFFEKIGGKRVPKK